MLGHFVSNNWRYNEKEEEPIGVTDQALLFLELPLLLSLFLTVVIRHGNDRQDQINEIERTEEDDYDEEQHVIRTVSSDYLNV